MGFPWGVSVFSLLIWEFWSARFSDATQFWRGYLELDMFKKYILPAIVLTSLILTLAYVIFDVVFI